MISLTLKKYLNESPNRTVIRQINGKSYSLDTLKKDVNDLVVSIQNKFGKCDRLVFGIAMRSSYEWVQTFLALQQINAVLLPVPIEFSDNQIESLLGKVSAVFVNDEEVGKRIKRIFPQKLCVTPDMMLNMGYNPDFIPGEKIADGIISIIHTSGTTSTPKGVMIRDEAIDILVKNVMSRLPQYPLDYFSIVPMSLLIEQVLGIFIPILSGGTLTLMPNGISEYGASCGNARSYLDLISNSEANFLYLPPKLLEEANEILIDKDSSSLFGTRNPHIITGGAKIPLIVLEDLHKKGINVFEAYGLSENSSIISLNSINEKVIGSVGKLLDGITPKIVNGELLVKTPTLCAGYYNSDDTSCDLTDGYLHTGDIAEIRDGFLYITGRKKHVIILSTARNISPEWVENVYKESPLIDDIIVMGEGKDEPCAIILSQYNHDEIKNELNKYEDKLSEFSRVKKILVINDIKKFREDFYTVTGRPRRSLIEETYIEYIY